MKRTLAIDIETYSRVSLTDCGVYKYVESPDFDILLCGYAYDNGPVSVIDLTKEPDGLMEIYDDLFDPEIIKTAFNANFERTCFSAYFKQRIPAEQWQCTAVLAKELGFPNSLEAVGAALGLPEDKQKLKTGKALIRYFSIPCRPTKANGGRIRNLPKHDLDRWAMYIEYNRQDVEAERAIRNKLLSYPVAESEHDLWVLDQQINDRGVKVDLEFAKAAVELDEQCKEHALERARALTGIENPKSVVQFKSWLENVSGRDVVSLEKKAIPELRKELDSPLINEALDLRSQLSKTSTEKYKAMIRCACHDSRIRGLTQFYGAGRTGRWAGRLVQMQNLPQNHLADLDLARELVLTGGLELVYDNPADTLSQLVRTAFVPKDGCRFIVSDFSAIEARVIAWLADEGWRMDVFRTHGKIYEASAEKMFNLPAGSVKKGDPLRQKGKIAELALGYGGSTGALKAMGALDMGLTEDELKPLVVSWRQSNTKITKFWWDVDEAVKRVLTGAKEAQLQHNIAVRRKGPLLQLRLPSGRYLSYVNAKLSCGTGAYGSDEISYDGLIQTTGQWGRVSTYGPKIVENIVQATARDCLAAAMRKLESLRFPIVFHVHDEVICEVEQNRSSAEEIANIMAEIEPWQEGLPLKADAYECNYYRKD